MLLEHPPCFFNQAQGFLPNEVVARHLRLLSLGNEPEQVMDENRAVFGFGWRVIDLAQQAILGNPRLHQFIETQAGRRLHLADAM